MIGPTESQALQFAVMIQSGLPASEAILYFSDSADPAELAEMTRKWLKSRLVARAIRSLMPRSWQEMSLDERCRHALDQHYSQLAYLLQSGHYAEVDPQTKAKFDTARQAIEAKLAGTAGKTDPLTSFFDDLKSGKLKLGKPVSVLADS